MTAENVGSGAGRAAYSSRKRGRPTVVGWGVSATIPRASGDDPATSLGLDGMFYGPCLHQARNP